MDKETEERIKADAEAYAAGIGDEYRKYASLYGYTAGATAEHDRAKGELKEAQDAARMFCNKHNETATQLAEVVDKAQVLVDALEAIAGISMPVPNKADMIEIAKGALAKWKGEVEETKPIEYMPIHPDDAKKFDCPTQFPMHLLDEAQAQRNHGQSLKRLKERGGLNVREILAIVSKQPWGYYAELPWNKAIKMLNDIVITNPQK